MSNKNDDDELTPAPMEDGEPGPDDALTIDEMIARLEGIRATAPLGGRTPIFMCDQEPVVRVALVAAAPLKDAVRAALRDEDEPASTSYVVVTDRF